MYYGWAMDPNRKDILLRACYDMLKIQDDSHITPSPLEIETFYDGVMCDGYCLKQDIETVLNLEEDTQPLKPSRKKAGK